MGKIIEFEGIDGAGKSTQALLLYHELTALHIPVELITPKQKMLSESILSFLRQTGAQPIEMITLLSAANDLSLAERLKEPGKVFILDRYVYTSIAAYNVMCPGSNWAFSLYKPFQQPDLVINLDIPAEIAAERKKGNFNPFEEGSSSVYLGAQFLGFLDFQSRMRNSYLELAEKVPNFKVLDGQISELDLKGQITNLVSFL